MRLDLFVLHMHQIPLVHGYVELNGDWPVYCGRSTIRLLLPELSTALQVGIAERRNGVLR